MNIATLSIMAPTWAVPLFDKGFGEGQDIVAPDEEFSQRAYRVDCSKLPAWKQLRDFSTRTGVPFRVVWVEPDDEFPLEYEGVGLDGSFVKVEINGGDLIRRCEPESGNFLDYGFEGFIRYSRELRKLGL